MREADPGLKSMLAAVEVAAEETGEQQDVESTEEVIPLLDQFDVGLRDVNFDKLEPYLLEFEVKLRELVKELGPGRIPKGYVGRQVLTSVLGHVGRIVSGMLGKEHALDSRDGIDFAIELSSILYPNTYGIPTYDITFYDELLKPESAISGRGAAVIREQIADELREKAARRIAHMQNQVNVLETEQERLAAVRAGEREFIHLTQLMAGFYPAPFNAEDQYRWLSVDVGTALDPAADPRDSFTLTPEHTDYLGKIARMAAEDYKAHPEVVARDPKSQHHQQVVQDFLNYGRLREPWHLAN